MFCPKCGTQLEDGAVFCPNCGEKVGKELSKPIVSFKIGNINFAMIKENFDLTGLIAAVVAFISLFLPFVTASAFGMSESVNIFSGKLDPIKLTGFAVFILIFLLVYIFLNLFGFKLCRTIAGYVLLFFMFITSITFFSQLHDVKKQVRGLAKVHANVGFYFLLIAILVVAFSGLIQTKLVPLIKSKMNK